MVELIFEKMEPHPDITGRDFEISGNPATGEPLSTILEKISERGL